jgi:hypothetical protein
LRPISPRPETPANEYERRSNLGSGAQGHPNKGYVLHPPYTQASFIPENFPGSVQTQVTGLNDRDATVGFYSHQNNANLVNENVGFYRINGSFHAVKFPTTNNSTPPVNQLLGVNDRDIAVGFYTDKFTNVDGLLATPVAP